MRVIEKSSPQFPLWLSAVEQRRTESSSRALEVAADVIAAVRTGGDAAVCSFLQKFDGVELQPEQLVIEPREVNVDPALREAIELAIARVRRFHAGQVQSSYRYEIDGGYLEHRIRPLRRVGVYVPGGGAVYLSTLIMCAVPAQLAGVRELVVATTPKAAERPELHYLCRRLGVKTIYRSGGPAGIAALALGTGTLQRVDKIAGPGNSYVTAAKQLLYGSVGIDMTAGPTEVVIVADASSDPRLVAADLLAQAEHGDDSAAICLTDDLRTGERIAAAVADQLASSPDSPASRSIPASGAVLVVDHLDEAIDFINGLGPEHVSVQADPRRFNVDAVENCGAIFVGPYAPVALGDYVFGPNHVLPTAGAARFFSPLGVYDFYKRTNRVIGSEAMLKATAAAGAMLARLEGLPLHAESIEARLASPESTCHPERVEGRGGEGSRGLCGCPQCRPRVRPERVPSPQPERSLAPPTHTPLLGMTPERAGGEQ
jgi:histidinol dehydrogenase